MSKASPSGAAPAIEWPPLVAAVLDTLWACVFVKGRDGRFLYLNPAAAAALGGPSATGRRLADVLGDPHASTSQAADAVVLETGAPHRQRTRVILRGRERLFDTLRIPWRGADGEVLGLVGISHELTEIEDARVRAAETDSLNRAIVESLEDAVFVIRRDGSFMPCNGPAEHMSGGGRARSSLFDPAWRFVRPTGVALTARDWIRDVFGRGAGRRGTFGFCDVEGRRRWIRVNVQPLPGDARDRPSAAIATARDVTEEREREQAEALELERSRALYDIVAGANRGLSPAQVASLVTAAAVRCVPCSHAAVYRRQGDTWVAWAESGGEAAPRELRIPWGARPRAILQEGSSLIPIGPEPSMALLLGRALDLADTGFVEALTHHLALALDRHEHAEALRRSEQRFRAIVEDQTELVCRFRPDCTLTFVNRAYAESFGVPVGDLVGRSFLDLIPEAEREIARAYVGAVAAGATPAFYEHRVIGAGGEERWQEWIDRAIRDGDGHVVELQSVGRDVTERRRQREQLRDLAARLRRVREEERARLARELHDELGQMLSVIKLDVAWSHDRIRRMSPQTAVEARLAEVSGQLDTMMKSLRRITSELRPATLDIALPDAIEAELEDFARRTGIAARMEAPEAWPLVPLEAGTALFRILQEALTNVTRHAEARAVHVGLSFDAATITMTVVDDGKGFSEADPRRRRSLGLLSMRERALEHGGELILDSAPGQGTRITVRLPRGEERA